MSRVIVPPDLWGPFCNIRTPLQDIIPPSIYYPPLKYITPP